MSIGPALTRWFFGHDVFICYSRSDGLPYATSLAFRLGELGTTVFVDIFGSDPGATTPAAVIRALRRASVLVVLCTPGALDSAAVLEEIAQFPPGRPVLPIRLGVDISALTARTEYLRGLASSNESEDAVKSGLPSDIVVRRVRESVGRLRQSLRLRSTLAGFGVALTILVTAIGWVAMKATRLAAAAEVAQTNVDRLGAQSAKLQAEVASATASLAPMRLALADSNKLANTIANNYASSVRESFRKEEDAPLARAMEAFPRVECVGPTRLANGPLMVPFQPGELRLAEVPKQMLDSVAQCLAQWPITLELSNSGLADEGSFALNPKLRKIVRDYLIGKGVDPGRLILAEDTLPHAARGAMCTYPCVLLFQRER